MTTLDEAIRLIELGQYEEAAVLLRRLTAEEPGNPSV
jgi:predicted Zn-dependent protease